ncbi:hypothetical protein GBA52_006698 [Prunus armeniaca]|nr:hypothetical protein GBA52_006698 [Prunus armeniaca]
MPSTGDLPQASLVHTEDPFSMVGQWDCEDRVKFLEDEYSFRCQCSGCLKVNFSDLVLNALYCVKPNCSGIVLQSSVVDCEKEKLKHLPNIITVGNMEPHLQAEDNLAQAFCSVRELQPAREHCKASIEILEKLSSIQLSLGDCAAVDSINQPLKIIENIQNLSVGLFCPRYRLYISVYTRASCVMLGSIAAAGAWIRKFKEYYVELQSLREKKVQDLMEIEVRLARVREKHIAAEILLSDVEKRARANEQLRERIARAQEQPGI